LALGLSGIFFTLFCFIGILILVPLWIWTLVDAIMMFAGGVTDGYGRKLQ
jgi:TM2 domain-containing membrane protein YozV